MVIIGSLRNVSSRVSTPNPASSTARRTVSCTRCPSGSNGPITKTFGGSIAFSLLHWPRHTAAEIAFIAYPNGAYIKTDAGLAGK